MGLMSSTPTLFEWAAELNDYGCFDTRTQSSPINAKTVLSSWAHPKDLEFYSTLY